MSDDELKEYISILRSRIDKIEVHARHAMDAMDQSFKHGKMSALQLVVDELSNWLSWEEPK